MRFTKLIFLLGAFALVSKANAQQAPYVDPALRALLRPQAQQAVRSARVLGPSMRADSQSLALGVAIRKTSIIDIPMVGIFAQLASEGGIAVLQAAGARIGARIGSVVSAEVPFDNLERVLTSSAFSMVEAARTIAVKNDTSMRVIRANAVRRVVGNTWTGSAGQGVIVGIYDSGLDFTHEDFLDPNGGTRVLQLWDQLDLNGVSAGVPYGRVCSRADISAVIATPNDRSACPQIDGHGHGTHVTGTAAGDGSATGTGGSPFTYAGVAPLADLMIVKGGEGLFSESGIIDGLAWLEREGRRLNRPMVVNLSLGGQTGPHDGSRLYELAIDSLSRPGFIVVVSAGNEAFNNNDVNPDGTIPTRNPTYFHGFGPPNTPRDFTFDIEPYTAVDGACNDFVNFSLWYYAPDTLDIAIVRADGSTVTAAFGQTREVDSPLGNVRIDNASGGPNARNNSYEADIRINDCGVNGSPPVSGLWTLRVSKAHSPSGKPYHFWMYSQLLGNRSTHAIGRSGFDNHYIVSTPGNARRAITVGAFVTKLCWQTPAKQDGPACYATRETVGDLARFSSAGPTRDGRQKPEITAPGLGIASSRSRFAIPAANRILMDGVHWMNEGTSMAAPHVTGTIALMLQARPTLTPEDVRDILSRSSDHDQFTSRVYDNAADSEPRYWWGFGKLNVCAALGATGSNTSGVAGPVVITPTSDTLPVNATTRFLTCSPTGAPVVFTTSNPNIATIDATGTLRALATGNVFVIATSGTFADTARVVVTNPASLAASIRNLAPTEPVVGKRGAQLPLLATTLRANGFEAIRVTQLTYKVTGIDPAARVILVADANRNSKIDQSERIIASKTVSLAGSPLQVDLPTDSLIIAQHDSVNLILAVELSGTGPNGGQFSAEYVASAAHTIGVRSNAANRVDVPTGSIASAVATTTILGADQFFSLSENPVRNGRVVFNFAQPPRTAAIYTLTGRRVTDLKPRIVGGSATWDLTNDDGERVASGVYFVIFDMAGQLVREKVFVIAGAR